MKVLLSGATSGTNFGDFLFAKMFQEYVCKIVGEENVFWNDKGYHSISEFYAKYLNYNRKFKLKDIDVLVYISGGYFCGADKHLKDYVFRYLRYFHIGILCMLRRKPYAIIAVEAAKSRNCVINYIQQILIRNAKVVVVRNQPSMDYVESILGKNCKAYCTADSVFAMKRSFFENYQIPKEIEYSPFQKLFLHCNPNSDKNQKIFDTIIPIINEFLQNHPNFQVIVSADQYKEGFNQEGGAGIEVKSKIKSANTFVYQYDNPIALCKVIDNCDVIVTTKLHIGIVGAHLRKSVISFSGHTQKISRLYEQLNISDRTLPLDTLTIKEGVNLLEKKFNTKVIVPDYIIKAANSNFVHLATFLKKYNNNL